MDLFATRGEKVFFVLNYIFLGLLAFLALFPFYLVVVRAIAPTVDYVVRDVVLYPSKITWQYFEMLFNDPATKIWVAYQNTIFTTVVGTLINMVMTIISAFPLAERKLPFRSQITFFILIPMFIGGTLLPCYILYSSLGLLNTLWVLIIPGAIGTYNLLLYRNFLMQLPEELLEASIIDGCSQLQTIWYIILPLSKAALATIGLFYAVGHWNAWFYHMVFLKSRSKYPLQLILREILITNDMSSMTKVVDIGSYTNDRYKLLVRYATIIIATLPILTVYPFAQRFFVKGVMIGAVKG